MSTRQRRVGRALLLAATLLGLALAIWLVRTIGWRDVADATEQMGAGGLALLCLYSLGIFTLLGIAWLVAAGEPPRRIPLFATGRLVREAVSDFLPLSQLGGLAAAARVLRVGDIPAPRIYASMIADQTTELASQLVFTLAGIGAAASLLLGAGGAAIRPTVIVAIAVLSGVVLLFLLGQRRFLRLSIALAHRLLPSAAGLLGEIDAELGRAYASRRRVVLSFAWNLAAWLATAGAGWLALRLIGHPLLYWRALSIESIIAVVRSIAFLVPGAIGFQEAAYAFIGPLFGLPPGAALALSLAKRARDVVMALIAIAAWQWVETGALLGRRPRSASAR